MKCQTTMKERGRVAIGAGKKQSDDPIYTDQNPYEFLWGKGDCICTKCLNPIKKKLYQVKYSGRKVFATRAYWYKYWVNDSQARLIQEPTESDEDLY